MHVLSKAGLLLLMALGCARTGNAQAKKFTVAEGIQAQILHSQGSSTIEVLIPGTEKMTLDLTQPVTNVFQVKTMDYNFDGYKDFAFAGTKGDGGIQVYDIYLYNPTDGQFEALDIPEGACETFGNIRLNPAEKTMRSSCLNGAKPSTDIYRWTTPFSLELLRSEDNSTIAQEAEQEEKAERKAEKTEQRQNKRDDLLEQRKDRREQRKEQQAERNDD